MCRGCLFVIVDFESGDIDGCLKVEALEELEQEGLKVPTEFYDELDEEKCFVSSEPCFEETIPFDMEKFYKTRHTETSKFKQKMRKQLEKRRRT